MQNMCEVQVINFNQLEKSKGIRIEEWVFGKRDVKVEKQQLKCHPFAYEFLLFCTVYNLP